MQQLPLGVRWRDNSVFGDFLPGSNALAVRQLQALERGTPVAIWLWGPSGSGKTHLLQASCARAGELNRHAVYFPLRQQAEFGPQALAGCEQLDLVCLDDVQGIVGRPDWERVLFNLYNGLQEHQGRLLLSAEQPLVATRWSLPDLSSRLAAGLVLQLQALTDEEQMQVLRRRAHKRGLELPEETARFLLRHYPRDLRTLCTLLDTLDLASLAAQRRLTVPFIKQALRLPSSA